MKTIKVYQIHEHPNPDKVYTWIRDNWHDLANHCTEEMVESLKAFAAYHNVTVDYALSVAPDRGEFVKFSGPVDFADKPDGDCPLTGMCYDHDLIESSDASDLEYKVLKTLHAEGEYLYSDEALKETCEVNEYHFFASGQVA